MASDSEKRHFDMCMSIENDLVESSLDLSTLPKEQLAEIPALHALWRNHDVSHVELYETLREGERRMVVRARIPLQSPNGGTTLELVGMLSDRRERCGALLQDKKARLAHGSILDTDFWDAMFELQECAEAVISPRQSVVTGV